MSSAVYFIVVFRLYYWMRVGLSPCFFGFCRKYQVGGHRIKYDLLSELPDPALRRACPMLRLNEVGCWSLDIYLSHREITHELILGFGFMILDLPYGKW